MDALGKTFRRLIVEENGPTATEYAVLLALIAMSIVVAMSQFGTKVSGIYSYIDTTMPT